MISKGTENSHKEHTTRDICTRFYSIIDNKQLRFTLPLKLIYCKIKSTTYNT